MSSLLTYLPSWLTLYGSAGAVDYTAFYKEWPNIKLGWQWALDQMNRGRADAEIRELLVLYAESIPYFDPFFDQPIETIKRLKAALNQVRYDASQKGLAHLWISLARACLCINDMQTALDHFDQQ